MDKTGRAEDRECVLYGQFTVERVRDLRTIEQAKGRLGMKFPRFSGFHLPIAGGRGETESNRYGPMKVCGEPKHNKYTCFLDAQEQPKVRFSLIRLMTDEVTHLPLG